MHPDIIKLDRSLVADVDTRPRQGGADRRVRALRARHRRRRVRRGHRDRRGAARRRRPRRDLRPGLRPGQPAAPVGVAVALGLVGAVAQRPALVRRRRGGRRRRRARAGWHSERAHRPRRRRSTSCRRSSRRSPPSSRPTTSPAALRAEDGERARVGLAAALARLRDEAAARPLPHARQRLSTGDAVQVIDGDAGADPAASWRCWRRRPRRRDGGDRMLGVLVVREPRARRLGARVMLASARGAVPAGSRARGSAAPPRPVGSAPLAHARSDQAPAGAAGTESSVRRTRRRLGVRLVRYSGRRRSCSLLGSCRRGPIRFRGCRLSPAERPIRFGRPATEPALAAATAVAALRARRAARVRRSASAERRLRSIRAPRRRHSELHRRSSYLGDGEGQGPRPGAAAGARRQPERSAARCTMAQFTADTCPAATEVGHDDVEATAIVIVADADHGERDDLQPHARSRASRRGSGIMVRPLGGRSATSRCSRRSSCAPRATSGSRRSCANMPSTVVGTRHDDQLDQPDAERRRGERPVHDQPDVVRHGDDEAARDLRRRHGGDRRVVVHADRLRGRPVHPDA